ncbi:MAG: gamma carbonic anhydrase family protein [Endomicrobiia bacterium]|nr:gamma carbonic anhydrase family protein [Endomicrobiia bacterium]
MIKQFDGHIPSISPSAYVADEAVVIGKVIIEKDASVWPGAVLRGDVEDIIIKEGSNVQDGALVHTNYGSPTIIGAGVTVGHGAVVHGAAIDDDCLIGMGAVLLDRVKVGRGSIIGAGAVVAEGSEIPPGKLVLGVPSKVVRDITPEEISKIKANAEDYKRLTRLYKKTCRRAI